MSGLSRLLAELTRLAEGVAPGTDPAVADPKGGAENEEGLGGLIDSEKKGDSDEPVAFEKAADSEAAEPMDGEAVDEELITSADMIRALEGVKQGIEEVKMELGYDPDSALFRSLQEVFEAVHSMQVAVVEDALRNPEAEVPLEAVPPLMKPSNGALEVEAEAIVPKHIKGLPRDTEE